jgi:aminopeptidase N
MAETKLPVNSMKNSHTCYDVKYYSLFLEIDPEKKNISGYNTIFFSILKDHDTLVFYLDHRLEIDSIICHTGAIIEYSRINDCIKIPTNALKIPTSGLPNLTVFYHGKPKSSTFPPWEGGFVWEKDSTGLDFIGVVCQLEGAKLWWPNKNDWADKPDSITFSIQVPAGLQAISNGRLKRTDSLGQNKIRYTWFSQYPILPYNLTVYVGNYRHFREYISNNIDSLTLDFYVLQNHLQVAKQHFSQVGEIIHVYEKYFGKYPFPKDGYKLVEAPYLGMEHQTAIGYGNKFKAGYSGFNFAPFPFKFDYAILHETAHEWWGNSLSAKTVNDLWINESFATYSESLFVENLFGYDSAALYVMNDVHYLLKNTFPLVDTIKGTIYGNDLYFKGSSIWYTFRNVLNDDAEWFRFLREIQSDYRYKCISTTELINYINQFFNYNYTSFFEQYVFNPQIPVLEIQKKTGSETYGFRWSSCIPGFDMPLKIETPHQTINIHPNTDWQYFSNITDLSTCMKKLNKRYLIKTVLKKDKL